jgi:soluble lytic murein transglycosylase
VKARRVLAAVVLLLLSVGPRTDERILAQTRQGGASLAPTPHPPLPGHPAMYWLVPESSLSRTSSAQTADTALSRFVRGSTLIANGDYAAGLPLVSSADLAGTPLAQYSRYYAGIALLNQRKLGEADAVLTSVIAAKTEGYLKEAAPLRLADVALALGDAKRAVEILDDVDNGKMAVPEEVALRLGLAAEAAGDRDEALEAFRHVYYDFPLSPQASDAQAGIERLQSLEPIPSDLFKRELARSERLFAARRWAQARAGFASLGRAASGDDNELVALRLAECDYYLDRFRASRDALRPFLDKSSREAEARFFHLTSVRALGDLDAYVTLATRLLDEHPDGAWAEETLNNLASHYIIVDDDAAADGVFRDLYKRFPKGRYAPRAAWKIGWYAYKNGRFGEAADLFDVAAAAYPRADYRPSWLYWSGRARDQMGETRVANARYQLVASDYLNSYYGRLASQLLAMRREPAVTQTVRAEAVVSGMPPPLVPNDAVIRSLVAADLFQDAMNEVQYAQRVWGDSPALQATVAWIRHERALQEKSNDRFADLRGAINTMRRAYPQFLAAGGENLPPDILRVIFPLDYWPIIKKYADAHDLDPYLMAALIAQESTFTPDVKSSANAVGLMQLIPPTARRYAKKAGIRYTASTLTTAESNVRLGMTYFKDLVTRFGGAHFALASYNAGEQRIARWIAERPGLARDEFIDDIPFPETQNYVKRILGTAEDYRRLYGTGILAPGLDSPPPATAAPATPARKPAAKPARRPARRPSPRSSRPRR